MDTWILIQCALRQQPRGFTHTLSFMFIQTSLLINIWICHTFKFSASGHTHTAGSSSTTPTHPSLLCIIPSFSSLPSPSFLYHPFTLSTSLHLSLLPLLLLSFCLALQGSSFHASHDMQSKGAGTHRQTHICTKCHFHILCLRQWNANHVSVYMESEI